MRQTPKVISDLQLREDAIIKTVVALEQRIEDRFAGRGISRLCKQLREVAEHSAVTASAINESVWWIRIVGYTLAALVVMIVGAMVWSVTHSVRFKDESFGWPDLLGMFDAGTNALLVLAATIYFLLSLEVRIKRRRALIAVHQLRSLAHVIDMHQLTKDPERTLGNYQAAAHSPADPMTAFELNRYLDYCSEMLSLIGKIAALYVQRFDDPVAVAAVSEIEQLSTGLSRKIWQKIVLLSQFPDQSSNGEAISKSKISDPKVAVTKSEVALESGVMNVLKPESESTPTSAKVPPKE
ncbi:hypothetical protein LOC67_23645 [Stieleria sp. JC731]|uniref:hypothetical protein n=1 Tax=Pirellulaceae TaxID=2691357 RepID=UPI001E616E3D|nr:hypothetical protein [Stieleria sp. JC731]MCC9603554.1 hypothetical protein [Stieleria sp. JC731]